MTDLYCMIVDNSKQALDEHMQVAAQAMLRAKQEPDGQEEWETIGEYGRRLLAEMLEEQTDGLASAIHSPGLAWEWELAAGLIQQGLGLVDWLDVAEHYILKWGETLQEIEQRGYAYEPWH